MSNSSHSRKIHKKSNSVSPSLTSGLKNFLNTGKRFPLKEVLGVGESYIIKKNQIVSSKYGDICEIEVVNIATDKTSLTFLSGYYVDQFKRFFEEEKRTDFESKEDLLAGVKFIYIGEKTSKKTGRVFQSIEIIEDA